jgi:hypothetical protein
MHSLYGNHQFHQDTQSRLICGILPQRTSGILGNFPYLLFSRQSVKVKSTLRHVGLGRSV